MIKINRLLSIILAVVLIVGVAIPKSNFVFADNNEGTPHTYESPLTSVGNMLTDGWSGAYSSDPQGGVAFEDKNLGDLFECWGGGITRKQNEYYHWSGFNWRNPFIKEAAMTYTAKKYKYFTMRIDYKFNDKNSVWPAITFGQPNTTPEMFYAPIGGGNATAAAPAGGNDAIGVYLQYEGHLSIAGKNAASSVANKNGFTTSEYRTVEITVKPDEVKATIYNTDNTVAIESTAQLTNEYEGGYISLMLGVPCTFFKNISITELEFEDDDSDTNIYSTDLRNVENLKNDGWSGAFSSDPQGGVVFEDENMSDLFECWSGGITRKQNGYYHWSGFNWKNPFIKTAAMTYTAKKYKYFTMRIDYKFNDKNSVWPAITFGQPNTTPEMFYAPIGGGNATAAAPAGGNDAIGVYLQYEGHLSIAGKNAASSVANKNGFTTSEYRTVEITVKPGEIKAAIYNTDNTVAIETTAQLNSEYEGGYISLMLGVPCSFFRNISITELEFQDDNTNPSLYSTDLRNVDNLKNDGWNGAYSSDPQDAIAFDDVDISELFECWGGGITRKQNKYYHWKGFNWKDPFINLGTLTYAAQKYKYFTMTVDYKFGDRNNVWPAISFGQPETTPEMFYAPIAYSDVQGNPKEVGSDAIGVYVQYEGYVNIAGKNATGASNVAVYDTNDWHTMKLSVVPGMVEVVLYDNEGNPVSTTTAILSDEYEGGYVSLMMGVPYSFFRNLSITEYEYIDMSQTENSDEISVELTEEQCKKPIIAKATPKRFYDFESMSPDEESGAEYEIKNVTSDIYLIEEAKPSVLNVKYTKRILDYDPAYTLKYYFDWEEELDDFVAYRTPNPADNSIEKTNLKDIWKIRNGILQKPVIDFTGTDKTSDPWSDFNTLVLYTQKFRNFELSVQYKH